MFWRVLATASAVLASALPALSAEDANLSVALDHARVLRIARPAETIIVGNPAIADVAVHDAQTLVVTGRSYGITNVVVLDAGGAVVIDNQVEVTSSEAGTLRIFRQASRSTYSCSPECEPRLTIGDNPGSFQNAGDQFEGREKMVGSGTGAAGN